MGQEVEYEMGKIKVRSKSDKERVIRMEQCVMTGVTAWLLA
jgi:site-specific recombinase XerD